MLMPLMFCFAVSVCISRGLGTGHDWMVVRAIAAAFGRPFITACIAISQRALQVLCSYDLCMAGAAKERERELAKAHMTKPIEPGGLCCYGDSEFAFWHQLREQLSQALAMHATASLVLPRTAFNAGFGGSTTRQLVKHIRPLCLNYQPSSMLLHFGGNDFDLHGAAVMDEVLADVRLICSQAHASGCRVYALFGLHKPAFTEAKWRYMQELYYLLRQSAGVSKQDVDAVVALSDFAILDDTGRAGVGAGATAAQSASTWPAAEYHTDGVHLLPVHRQRFAKEVADALATALKCDAA